MQRNVCRLRSLLRNSFVYPNSINRTPNSRTCVCLLRNFSLATAMRTDITVTFVRVNGTKVKAKAKEGDNFLDVVVNNNIDFDGFGACEGTCSCSTCQIIFNPEDYEKLPDEPADDEKDMLDLSYEITETSRLGCQVKLTKDMDGIEVKLPATINDMREA